MATAVVDNDTLGYVGARTGFEVENVTIRWNPSDLNHLIALYQSGESIKALADPLGISRTTLRKAFAQAGVQIRTASEQERIKWSRMTGDQRAQQVAAAHDAARGSKRSYAQIRKRVATDARKGLAYHNVGWGEVELGKAFTKTGHKVRHQVNILKYLCDLTVDGVPVEVTTTGPRRRENLGKISDLLHVGLGMWWVCLSKTPTLDCEKLIADFDAFRGDPSFRSQARMVWGDGQLAATYRLDNDKLTEVISYENRRNPANGRYERVPR